MRILFATQPVRSHLHALMPVILAARELGQQVAVASGRSLEEPCRTLGLEYLPCGLDLAHAVDPVRALPADVAATLADAPIVVRHLIGFSAGLGPRFAGDLLELGRTWRPDLIVREPVEFGSVIAAERWGMPYATVMWALTIDPRYMMREAYAAVIPAFGVDPEALLEGFDRHLVIRYLPPEWQIALSPDRPATRAFAAPPFDGATAETLPSWFAKLPDRPIVAVTLGLSFSRAPETFRAVIAALEGLEVEAVVTVGLQLDPRQLDPLPSNVHVARYIPASRLLPRCQAVVFHGGFNSLHGTLWHGLPSVVIPLEGGDQGPTAAHIEELGLGLHVPGPVPEPRAVSDALARILDERAFGDRARAMRDGMHALPPIEEAVGHLERLTAGGVAPRDAAAGASA